MQPTLTALQKKKSFWHHHDFTRCDLGLPLNSRHSALEINVDSTAYVRLDTFLCAAVNATKFIPLEEKTSFYLLFGHQLNSASWRTRCLSSIMRMSDFRFELAFPRTPWGHLVLECRAVEFWLGIILPDLLPKLRTWCHTRAEWRLEQRFVFKMNCTEVCCCWRGFQLAGISHTHTHTRTHSERSRNLRISGTELLEVGNLKMIADFGTKLLESVRCAHHHHQSLNREGLWGTTDYSAPQMILHPSPPSPWLIRQYSRHPLGSLFTWTFLFGWH